MPCKSTFRPRPRRLWQLAGAAALAVLTGCAVAPMSSMDQAPMLAAGKARVWVYRDFLPGETMSVPAVAVNEGTVGYAYPGTNFYLDLPAGHYHVTVESYGKDVNQSQDLDLAPGQQEYVKIMSAPHWVEGVRSFRRETYYARSVTPRMASLEMPLTSYRGN